MVNALNQSRNTAIVNLSSLTLVSLVFLVFWFSGFLLADFAEFRLFCI